MQAAVFGVVADKQSADVPISYLTGSVHSPLRLAAEAVPRALGAAGSGRGSDLPDLDRGQPAAAGVVSGAAGGQAGNAGRAAGAASTEALV